MFASFRSSLVISVVIPAFNEEKCLPACLEALVHQTTTLPFEVIIVNNNSADRTAEVALSYADRLNLRVVFEARNLRGAARRAGFAAATGDLIFSTDADTIPSPTWIDTFARILDKYPKIVAVCGTTRIDDCPALTNALYNYVFPLSLLLYHALFGSYFLTGANFAIRRDIYEKTGGFHEGFDAQEDLELSKRVREYGRISWSNRAAIVMSGRRFRRGFLRGWWSYFSTYVAQFWFKQEDVRLSNPE